MTGKKENKKQKTNNNKNKQTKTRKKKQQQLTTVKNLWKIMSEKEGSSSVPTSVLHCNLHHKCIFFPSNRALSTAAKSDQLWTSCAHVGEEIFSPLASLYFPKLWSAPQWCPDHNILCWYCFLWRLPVTLSITFWQLLPFDLHWCLTNLFIICK